jgi:SAM-dependent methyltransferase
MKSRLRAFRRTRDDEAGVLLYRCNVCGTPCREKVMALGRESPSCEGCGSTVRMRAIIRALSVEVFAKSLALCDFPERRDLRGLGLSDWDAYAVPLASKFHYTNTFYHQDPRLDITRIDPALEGTLDFLIATDVFEHVPPPASVAFVNARRLLKPGGSFVFSVPYAKEGPTREHFPELAEYELFRQDGRPVLRNRTRDGRVQVFEGLVFHGGEGVTLEMRVFSEPSLVEEFSRAGFRDLRIHAEPDFEHGIYWSQAWSLPMTAKR